MRISAAVLLLVMSLLVGIGVAGAQQTSDPTHWTNLSIYKTNVDSISDVGAVSPSTSASRVESLAGESSSDQAPDIHSQPIQLAQDRMRQCLTCCAGKLQACGNDARCNVLYQNCVANCNSHGETPADWRCW